MDKRLIIAFIFTLPFSFFGQEEKEPFEKVNIVRASGTYGIGSMPGIGLTNLSVPTSLEYYLEEQVSVRADAVWFLGHSEETYMGFIHNHSVLVGVSYHLTKNKMFDPYIGLQPGMAFSQYGIIDKSKAGLPEDPSDEYYWLSINEKSSFTLNSLFSPHIGFNYYAKNFFHLFMAVRYVYGNHHSNISMKSLEEIRFEFGLGLDLRLDKYLKKKV